MRKAICRLLIQTFCLGILFVNTPVVSAVPVYKTSHIIILNSYHQGLSWTDQEVEGILRILNQAPFPPAISIEYMDWMNDPSQENLNSLYSRLEYKYSSRPTDLVITTDDAALDFALKYRKPLFSDAPIIYSGLNRQEIAAGHDRVGGVTEWADPERTVSLARMLQPDLKRLYVVHDKDAGEASIPNSIRKAFPDLAVIPLDNAGLEELVREAAHAPSDSAFLVGIYYNDMEKPITGYENLIRLISRNSRVPVWTLYEMGIGSGALGGRVLSGRLQGEDAGRMALRALQGEDVGSLPVPVSPRAENLFDYNQLKRFNIPMFLLPPDSRVVNKKISFFETYSPLVLGAAVVFLLLLVLIAVLVRHLKNTGKLKDDLYRNHQILSRLHRELQASDRELRRRFEEAVQARKQLESSEEQYALLFEKMLNGFIVIEFLRDPDGRTVDYRIIKANPGAERQLGLDSGQLVGQTFTGLFQLSALSEASILKLSNSSGDDQFEVYKQAGGQYFLVSAFPIQGNQYGAIFENVTNYKRALREIQLLNEGLELRVEERTLELRQAVQELERFAYTVSHDLKAPLRAVEGYVEILLEDYGPSLDNDANEMIQSIRRACRNMIDMIDKLLLYTTASKAPLTREWFSMEGLFLYLFKEAAAACPDRVISFRTEPGMPPAWADQVLLRQAVSNLISNAVKYTGNREFAVIEAGFQQTDRETVYYLKDNGAGFDMKYSHKLFGLFQRLHTDEEFEGFGIGLVTVKNIIQRHGGRVWITGETGCGATVYFTLPRQERQ